MRKLFKFIFGILGIILLLAIVAVVVVAILLYDNSNNMNQDIIDANKEVTEVIEDLNYDALETTSDDKLSYTFSEYKMNELIYALTKDLKLDPVEIKGVYTEYQEDGTFTLNMPAKVYFFSSLLSAKLEVKDNDGSITLTVKDLKVGKISSTNFLVKSIMTKTINAETIESAINSASPIKMGVTYENNELSCTIQDTDFFDLIKTSLGDGNELYSAMIDVISSNPNLFEISFDGESKGFVVNLKELESTINSKYTVEDKLNINEDIIAKVEDLTSNGLGTSDATVLINYLLRGYNNIDEDDQTIINNLDLSSLTVTDYKGNSLTLNSSLTKKNWLGMIPRDDTTLADVIAAQTATLTVINPEIDVKLTDDSINATMDDQSFLGTSFIFYNKEKKANYITVSNAYITCHSKQMSMFVIIDLNGKEIQAEINLACTGDNKNYRLTGTLNELRIGNVACSAAQAFSIMDYIKDIIDIDGFISLDSTANTVTLNFEEYFKNDSTISAIPDGSITSTMTIEEGYINVHYKLA